MRYIYHMKFRMLEVRENEIALHKLSGGIAHLKGNTAPKQKYGSFFSCESIFCWTLGA